MTKHELKQLMTAKLSAKLSVLGYTVSISSTVKSNDQLVESIVISSSEKISQAIHIDWVFQEYYRGISIDEIVNQIISQVIDGVPVEIREIAETVSDFEATKKRIFASLVNTRFNEKWLHDKPHYDIEDLSVVYHVVINHNDSSGMMRIPITDLMFETWRIEAPVLHELAMHNTCTFDCAVLSPMTQKLKELTDGSIDLDVASEVNNLIVVSNKMCLYGAIHMLNTNALYEASELLMTTKLCILPSSVHEIIVCPFDTMNLNYANRMVCEVNRTMDTKDVLSNHVYLYNRDANRVSAI